MLWAKQAVCIFRLLKFLESLLVPYTKHNEISVQKNQYTSNRIILGLGTMHCSNTAKQSYGDIARILAH